MTNVETANQIRMLRNSCENLLQQEKAMKKWGGPEKKEKKENPEHADHRIDDYKNRIDRLK